MIPSSPTLHTSGLSFVGDQADQADQDQADQDQADQDQADQDQADQDQADQADQHQAVTGGLGRVTGRPAVEQFPSKLITIIHQAYKYNCPHLPNTTPQQWI